MKILKAFLYCLLWFTLAFLVMYISKYKEENSYRESEIISMNVETGVIMDDTLPIFESFTLSYLWDSKDSMYNCYDSSNPAVKASVSNATVKNGMISKLVFYYYNVDDPNRILDYKETLISNPYVYFSIPKIWYEYKFWVKLYDNKGWMIDSEELLSGNPSLYLPSCTDADTPIVTLKLSDTDVRVWDAITYSVVSRIPLNDEDSEKNIIFYYDFTGDWIWDLVTQKDEAVYTFSESYEWWITPRAAVEYRWKLWIWKGAEIYVKKTTKPILLYNSIGNTVIFRDLSIWVLQQRQVCFEVDECKAGNNKYQKTHIVTVTKEMENQASWSSTAITENDSFLQKYPEYWTHNVSLYLKDRYWIEVSTWFTVRTSDNSENWRIAPGINMITIPETTFNNSNPEIFLSKAMNNTVLMYINNDTGEDCYVDMDTAIDSDGNGKTDDDMDIVCNKMVKVVYQPNYESAIWRIYFTNNWQVAFKNFYVQFEWNILELDDEKLAIYKDIITLMNWIEDSTIENINLKTSLNALRTDLNNITVVTPIVIAIKEQIDEWWIKLTQKQKDLLDSILDRLSNSDTVVSVWMSEYEIMKMEIVAIIQETTIKWNIRELFSQFEGSISVEEKAAILERIFEVVIEDGGLGMYDKRLVQNEFCSIVEYHNLSNYTELCKIPQDNYSEIYRG